MGFKRLSIELLEPMDRSILARVIMTKLKNSVIVMVPTVVFIMTACTSTDPTESEGPLALQPTGTSSIAMEREIVPLTREDLEKELSEVSFRPGSWPNTDFSLRTVPLKQFSGGGPPKDGIPAVDRPNFESISEGNKWMEDQEPVQAVSINGESKAYPQKILIWHEIVNDVAGDEPISITYCPLCNTSFVYSRKLDGRILDFGTTGLLRFSNLVMYDRQTESWWQEATGEAIVGQLAGSRLEALPFNVVAWRDYKENFPQGKVLSRNTGYDRDYGINPYVRYDSSEPFLYHGPEDKRLRATERVLGISIRGQSLAIPYPALEKEQVLNLTFANTSIVVFFVKGTASNLDSSLTFDGRDIGSASVYVPIVDGKTLRFKISDGRFMDEQTGSTWNIFGKAISGKMAGKKLVPITYHPAQFWFSWVVFKPDTQIYREK